MSIQLSKLMLNPLCTNPCRAISMTKAHMDTLTSNCIKIARTSSIFPLGRSWLKTIEHWNVFDDFL